ncbi:hypothetical protein AB0O22_19030 [Streptomyces sp. NPDC091204]|uniref:hypothetical protein n=1 Tax=Streptomyces sp. NPDC091204 TaxID=3155299 RepID=UPI00343BA0B5
MGHRLGLGDPGRRDRQRRLRRAGPDAHRAPDPGYAGALFGLHLYTWALITFLAAAAAAAAALFLTPVGEPLDAGLTFPALRRAGVVTLVVIGL